MIKKLFFPLTLLSLAFLSLAPVEAMEEEERGLRGDLREVDARIGKLSVGGISVEEQSDESEDFSGSASQAVLPNPHITIGEDGLLRIEGSFDIPGKGERAPLTVYLRTATDQDFLLGEEEEAPADALAALGQMTAVECGDYPAHRFGFVTIQRRNPTLMEPFINGPRAPKVTIGDHWFGAAPGWRGRLAARNAATCYVLEKAMEGGARKPFGHFLLGSLNAAELILSLVIEEADWRRGIGEGTLHHVLEVLIPELGKNDLTRALMSKYTSLVMLMDDQNSVAPGVVVKIADFQHTHPQHHILHADGVPRGDTRPGYEGRTGHRWTFGLESFKVPSSPFTPSS